MKNKIAIIETLVGIFALMLLALIFVMAVSAQSPDIPIKLELTAKPSTITVGETSVITIRLLDINDKNVVAEVDTPVDLSTNLEYESSYLVIPAGTNLLLTEFTSKVPGIAIISVKSKGLISDTTSIAVLPLSGGGGGASGELYENIVCSETDRQSVYKNSDISYSFELECNIVQYVNFTGLTSAGKIITKVEILNDTSTLVDNPPSDIVYKNLNIWVGNAGWATNRNIADATVVFTVEKSWITENNIDESSIAFYRYSDNNWDMLLTRKVNEDYNRLYFEAETPGFSPFAVTGKELEGETGGEGIIEPTVTAEKTPAPTPTEEKGMPGFGLFAGLSILLIAGQLLRKKN